MNGISMIIDRKRLNTGSLIYQPFKSVTAIEFNPHARVTGLDNNNLDVPGRDWIECVQHWSEMITVASENL